MINIIIITDPTFSRVLKILIVFFSHDNFFVKMFFITSLQGLLSLIVLLMAKSEANWYKAEFSVVGSLRPWRIWCEKTTRRYFGEIFLWLVDLSHLNSEILLVSAGLNFLYL